VKQDKCPSYEDTIKDPLGEEWIARIFLRPVAYRIVLFLYPTRVHSVHVTACFLAVGLIASWLITSGAYAALIAASLLIQMKSILDAVDGQLARARNSPSRVGRFFDSAADFIVGFFLIMACAFLANGGSGEYSFLLPGIAAFLSSEIQNSYWVYYNILHRSTVLGKRESVVEESHASVVYPYDRDKLRLLAFLKGFYRVAYGWQDRFIERLDRVSRLLAGVPGEALGRWYTDVRFLRAGGLLGLGTHLLVMSITLVLGRPSFYLVFALYLANVYMLLLVVLRVVSFARTRKNEDSSHQGVLRR
jgi:phosphatidylglycerophosphate synthase